MTATPARRMTSCQRGAMFGLDARLAMMVFAIMATVAGYVAFGRINIARSAALIKDIEAMDQGLAAYQNDMGTFFLFTLNKEDMDESSAEDITALWRKDVIKEGFQHRWHGPYVTFEDRKHRLYGMWSVFYGQPDRMTYCTTESACYVWLSLGKVPAKMWNEVNAYYDERGGSDKEPDGEATTLGRVQADAPTDPRTLIIRSIERPVK